MTTDEMSTPEQPADSGDTNTTAEETGGHREPEPSDSLATFGAVVQGLREHAELSREELGQLVQYSKHTVASIEQGRRMPDLDFVEAAEEALGNLGVLRKAFAKVVRRRGLAAWFRQWAGHEQQAIRLCTYECRLVPGLLQTAAYTRILFEHRLPPLSDEEVQTQLAAREERQRLLLERPHTEFSFVMDEHVLLRRTGGAEVTRELVQHLLDLAARRNILIQVLPLNRGVHPGLSGPLRLLETPAHQWFGYVEGQRIGQLISDPESLSVLQSRYDTLRAEALSREESHDLLDRLRGTL